jgi:MFS family permease
VRDVYGGSSTELSWMNAANSMGMVLTILLLLRFGDLHKQGRALLISQSAGAIALAGAGLGLGFPSLIAFIFCWGMCGGVGMTMARTIMQELAPPNQRARMMAFFSFSFMGSGPLGALMNGYLCDWLGPTNALLVASSSMLAIVAVIALQTRLWQLDAAPRAA